MEERRDQQSHYVSSQAYPDVCLEDEVNLLDIWRVLVRQWKVICAITGLSFFGAVAYVLLVTPVYEAQAVVTPPESKYVEVMNISDISQVSSADIFAKFRGNLKSSSLCQQFVEENPQFSSLRGTVPNIKDEAKNEVERVVVGIQGYDAKLLTDWVNGFIILAEKKTIGDFSDGIEVKIINQKKTRQDQLQIGRDFASKRRQDRIALLEDQIAIARASKIFDRKLSTYSRAANQGIGVTLNTVDEPLYLRGVKELTAEKEELEKRKDDEPFIDGFRDKQASLAQLDAGLKQLEAARAVARAVAVDQLATQAKTPVKPRRMLVLSLSVLLGGIIGIFVAFVANLMQSQKAKIKS